LSHDLIDCSTQDSCNSAVFAIKALFSRVLGQCCHAIGM